MNFVGSVVPSLLRRQIFFESLQFPQSVLYKSSYLQKYDAKVTSSSGEYEKFSTALQMVFCKKENSFFIQFLWLVSSKICFWNSSCFSSISFWYFSCFYSISFWYSSCFCWYSHCFSSLFSWFSFWVWISNLSILSWSCYCSAFWNLTKSNKAFLKSSMISVSLFSFFIYNKKKIEFSLPKKKHECFCFEVI